VDRHAQSDAYDCIELGSVSSAVPPDTPIARPCSSPVHGPMVELLVKGGSRSKRTTGRARLAARTPLNDHPFKDAAVAEAFAEGWSCVSRDWISGEGRRSGIVACTEAIGAKS
jgi:hypothetical protein